MKKTLSIILSLIIVFGCSSIAFAGNFQPERFILVKISNEAELIDHIEQEKKIAIENGKKLQVNVFSDTEITDPENEFYGHPFGCPEGCDPYDKTFYQANIEHGEALAAYVNARALDALGEIDDRVEITASKYAPFITFSVTPENIDAFNVELVEQIANCDRFVLLDICVEYEFHDDSVCTRICCRDDNVFYTIISKLLRTLYKIFRINKTCKDCGATLW